MKKYSIKARLMAVLVVCTAIFAASCEKEEDPGTPSIETIRALTAEDPITYANLGQSIAIEGNNLKSVKKITFNGHPGIFKTTMVTNTSIVVYVSKDTPFLGDDASNEMVLTTDGGEVKATLEIAPPAPEITSVSPEYAGEGGIITIKGNYFYNISSVKIGDATAQIISETPFELTVKVPEGYTKNNISVASSKSGEGASDFTFGLDDGMVLLNWSDISPSQGAWWNNAVDGPADDFDALETPYKYVESTFGNTWWTLDGGIQFDANDHRKGNPAAKVLKFEYASIGDTPWIQFLWKSSEGEYKHIAKNLSSTDGKWATYTIPMNAFTLGDDGPEMTQTVFESDNPLLMQYAFVNSGNSEITIKCGISNIRFTDK